MVSIMDLSGSVLKHIRISNAQINVLPACLNLVCTRVVGDCIWVLDPATEDCAPLPSWQYDCVVETYAFGQVASTGQYKGLRIIHLGLNFIDPSKHLCEVITLDESNHRTWRRKQCSPVIVHPEKLFRRGGFMKNVVFNGIVFMMILAVLEPAGVVPFNLETEEWMSTIPGPELLRSLVGVELEHPYVAVVELNCNLSLANLNSCLVTVHNFRGISIDLWFLMDCNRGLWVKNYSISVQLQHDDLYLNEAYPLLVLDDGRIVLYIPEMGC
uniref:F-box associated domain-containing protein n=1 Tax=Arundo donax TaxID=35708 RepID=A0A0A9CA61_ARUDO